MQMLRSLFSFVTAVLLAGPLSMTAEAEARPIRFLFLGDQGHHKPALRCAQLKQAFGTRGIHLYYTEDMKELNPENLAKYDGLMVYANIGGIAKDQETAILDYAASGGAYVPVHCASYCFLNSPKLIALLGA